jgi:hypothetical protein
LTLGGLILVERSKKRLEVFLVQYCVFMVAVSCFHRIMGGSPRAVNGISVIFVLVALTGLVSCSTSSKNSNSMDSSFQFVATAPLEAADFKRPTGNLNSPSNLLLLLIRSSIGHIVTLSWYVTYSVRSGRPGIPF